MVEQDIVNSSPIGFFVFELTEANKFILRFFNPIAEKLTNMDLSSSVGENVQRVFPHLVDSKAIKHFKWIAKEGGVWQNEKFSYQYEKISRLFNVTAYQIKLRFIAVMFQETSEKIKIAKIKTKRINELQFLTETALDFVSITNPQILYDYFGAKMREIITDSLIVIADYHEKSNSFKPQGVYGLSNKVKQITKILGKDPKKLTLTIKDEFINDLIKGKLTLLNKDFQDIIIKSVSTKKRNLFWKTFNLDKSYVVAIIKEGKIYGLVVITLKQGKDIENIELIEAFTHQLALALFRFDTESELFESEYRFMKLVELMNDGLGIDDINGNFMYVNNKLCEILGYTRNELIGKPVIDLLEDESRKKYINLLAIVQRDEITAYELEWKKKDRTLVPTLVKPMPLYSKYNEHIGSYAVITDISEIKEAYTKLESKQVELQRQKDELDSFTSTVAHDFRGKLQILSSLVDLQGSEHTEMILDQIDSLATFIEDLLVLAREGNILGEFQEIDLQIFVRNITDDLLHINKKIEYKISDLPKITADPVKLKQVFENLFMNILKHAKATRVEIIAKELKNEYKIKIIDNGKGFTEKKLKEIKKSWVTRRYNSFGMLIVLKIVEAHKGRLDLESTLGKGTTVTIVLPKQIKTS